ncbi:gliding motility lipoprotein GldD [Rudanella paleaurantiibacter]|uniref:Gliding motility lipoprotein GldD n=1 Tax=Rudanella paleaurantiibacter TaxID=2614655 RepID=A0A7J5U121_9BACT|nr:gliding motility lipoprotein GldD [Rudanella paleaurantiibacter]KAB7731462.1 gliding motility lipoprotein GldD [Rudanella paleaurantiibacter]
MSKHLILAALLGLTACGSSSTSSDVDYIPKPKGYPRIDLPPHRYVTLPPNHPYQFEVNRMARVLPDSFARAEPHWIFIYYPAFQASVQLTYKPVLNSPERLKSMLQDSYKLAGKHKIKATAIREQIQKLPSGLWANVIELEGEVPTQVQFITTDTTTHFLRGALYFNTATANDSLAPVIQYVRQDILHMLKTLKWRK